VELPLITIISLLAVCLAAFLFNNVGSRMIRIRSLLPRLRRSALTIPAGMIAVVACASPVLAASHEGGEASLKLPDLSSVTFFGGLDGHRLLLVGIVICVLGLGSGWRST